jgi:hypothetical protein
MDEKDSNESSDVLVPQVHYYETPGLLDHWKRRAQEFYILAGSGHLSIAGSASMQVIRPEGILSEEHMGTPQINKYPGVLLHAAVVGFGNKTPEGQLIWCVAFPWFEIIERLTRDPAAAYEILSRTWEEIIAGAYKKAGFDQVTLTLRSGDYASIADTQR